MNTRVTSTTLWYYAKGIFFLSFEKDFRVPNRFFHCSHDLKTSIRTRTRKKIKKFARMEFTEKEATDTQQADLHEFWFFSLFLSLFFPTLCNRSITSVLFESKVIRRRVDRARFLKFLSKLETCVRSRKTGPSVTGCDTELYRQNGNYVQESFFTHLKNLSTKIINIETFSSHLRIYIIEHNIVPTSFFDLSLNSYNLLKSHNYCEFRIAQTASC